MRNLFWGLVLITLGVLFLLDNLGIADFSYLIRTYWPVIFILWGIHVLLRKKNQSHIEITTEPSESLGDLIHRSNIFGDESFSVNSQNFKGGSISNVFGDINLDLSKTVIADGEHVLRLNSVFGDTIIQAPKDCAIAVTASVVFGDLKVFNEKAEGIFKDINTSSPGYQTASKKIRIHVSQIFGDLRLL
ncbi:MAG: cell wall-active antibiotics response protein LiaF [Bacteroidota bacterium]|nr:cell wall-active antibiotics response protein LiaF [Bacteroidota bacterium]